jgi:ribonuclease BN (tRNA processing enzyme)
LGSADAFCSGGHPQAAYLLETDGSAVMVDCGPTALLSLKQRRFDTARLDAVIVSHFHGDHFGGLPYLLLEYMWESLRDRPLIVAGPPGIEQRVWALFRALYHDVMPEQLPFELQFRELQAEVSSAIAGFDVFPVRVPHQVEDVALALRFTVGNKRLLYSGDSPWCDRFLALADGVDLFLCECTGYEDPHGTHIDWRTLERFVPQLKCRRLVLVHLGREMRERCGALGVECATEGLRIEL